MKKINIYIANPNFIAMKDLIKRHDQSHAFEVNVHKPSAIHTIDNAHDLYVLEVQHPNAIQLLKSLEEKKTWTIAILKEESFLREVVSTTHTICLCAQFTIRELHIAISKILALLRPTNEAARPVFSKQTIMNPAIASMLTHREVEMLSDIIKGKMYKEIAETKGITIGTVKQHVHKIYHKIQVTNKIEALNRCSLGMQY